jgi:nucleoid-associated protein YgaU
MSARIRNSSRLRFARLVTIDTVEHWELPEYPAIAAATSDGRYTVDRGDRIDRLANYFYGDPSLWWVIALANGMALLPSDLKPGEEITIPSQRRVFTEILRRASGGLEGR